MSIVLKVKPDVLKTKANSITKSINSIEKELGEIETIILGTKKYWEGDASTTHQKSYKDIKDDVPKVIKRLKEHPTDLLKMANLYDSTETANKTAATKLPSNVIV